MITVVTLLIVAAMWGTVVVVLVCTSGVGRRRLDDLAPLRRQRMARRALARCHHRISTSSSPHP